MRFTITSSARNFVETTADYQDAQKWAWKLAEAEALYLTGNPHAWHLLAKIEWTHNADGNVDGCRILRLPTGQFAAHITPTEVIGTVQIDTDWAAVQAEREAEARRLQVEMVRAWMAAGIPVPEHYPVQPADLEPEPVDAATVEAELRATPSDPDALRLEINAIDGELMVVDQLGRMLARPDDGEAERDLADIAAALRAQQAGPDEHPDAWERDFDARAATCPCLFFGDEGPACLKTGRCEGWAPYPALTGPAPAEGTPNAYERKLAARRARLERKAAAAAAAASRRFGAARAIGSQIPMGQPILVGHHSEGRHRRDLARIDAHMRKGVAAQDRAEELRGAAAAVGTGGISSDDPEALAKLQAKLGAQQARHRLMVATNKAWRLKGAERRQAALAALGHNAATVARYLAATEPPFARYELSNSTARIKATEQRIAQIQRDAAAQAEVAPLDNDDRADYPGHRLHRRAGPPRPGPLRGQPRHR